MSTDEELQAWLDELSSKAAKEEAQRREDEREARRHFGSWEEQKYNFKVHLYKQAIGA